MEVIFTKSVSKSAVKGSVKNVKPGYFRNFLQPRGLALLATSGLKTVWEKRAKQELLAKDEWAKNAVSLKERLEGKTFSIAKKATSKGTLYSAVTAVDVANVLLEQAMVEVDPKVLVVKSQLKKAGIFQLPLQLADGVDTTISLEITATPVEKTAKKSGKK